MKKTNINRIVIASLMLLCLALSSCSVSLQTSLDVPPGHAKKATNDTSAADYTPGHNR